MDALLNSLRPGQGYSVILLAIGSFLLTVLLTRPLIGWLKAGQFGKAIRVDGPDHAAKAGTPTMGGIGMLVSIGLIGLVVLRQVWLTGERLGWSQSSELSAAIVALGTPLLAMVLFAGLGLIDDLVGLARRSGKHELGAGLTARQMIVIQVFMAMGIAYLMQLSWSNWQDTEPSWLGIMFGVLIIVGTVNGVNFSDGLDGLAAGLLVIAFGTIAVLVAANWFGLWAMTEKMHLLNLSNPHDYYAPEIESVRELIPVGSGELAAICSGACLGFLVFNRRPARVIMGNVASMGLGATLAVLSINSGNALLLPIFGAVFVAEVLSDIIQVGYFKWTGGKRFFRMAPLHHHFEKGGMPETQIVRRFWLVGLLSSLVAIELVALDIVPSP
jgi:phospho-N-acetylmuramoyl-pentapeptide-transferase